MSIFVVTNNGLLAAAAATPSGPYIHITGFRLGDNATTAALATDTGLAGTTVYTGAVASYSYYDATTIQVNLEVPSTAGPFNYGEVALDMSYGGGTMFARFSYGVLRTKTASSLTGYSNSLRIKALIRISQGPAVFSFVTGVPQTTLELSGLNVLQTPTDHTDSPMIIVHEANDYQESLLVHKHTGTLWSADNYVKIGTTVVSAAADSTHVTAPLFNNLYMAGSGNNGKYLIQTAGGYMRSVSGLSGTTATLASAMVTSGLPGTTISVYQLALTLFAELNAAIAALPSGFVVRTGDTMTGPLILSADAVASLEAVTKQQMIAADSAAVTSAVALAVPRAGGVTMTGQYNLSANASSAMEPTPLQQVNSLIAAIPAATVPVPLAGGVTMTGQYNLSANAGSAMQPVPLQQLTSAIAAISLSLGTLSTGATAPNGSGYMAFTNGLILQWCSQSSGDTTPGSPGSIGTINFPMTFPNHCLSCHPTLFAGTSDSNVSVALAGGPTTTQAYYQVQEWGASAQAITVCIFAIGY
jgi:hypothetical protein